MISPFKEPNLNTQYLSHSTYSRRVDCKCLFWSDHLNNRLIVFSYTSSICIMADTCYFDKSLYLWLGDLRDINVTWCWMTWCWMVILVNCSMVILVNWSMVIVVNWSMGNIGKLILFRWPSEVERSTSQDTLKGRRWSTSLWMMLNMYRLRHSRRPSLPPTITTGWYPYPP